MHEWMHIERGIALRGCVQVVFFGVSQLPIFCAVRRRLYVCLSWGVATVVYALLACRREYLCSCVWCCCCCCSGGGWSPSGALVQQVADRAVCEQQLLLPLVEEFLLLQQRQGCRSRDKGDKFRFAVLLYLAVFVLPEIGADCFQRFLLVSVHLSLRENKLNK